MERVIWYQCAIILSLVGLSPVENFKSEIVMLQPLFASLLQAVMDNSTGDSLTKYPQSTMMMDPHTGKTKGLVTEDNPALGGVH